VEIPQVRHISCSLRKRNDQEHAQAAKAPSVVPLKVATLTALIANEIFHRLPPANKGKNLATHQRFRRERAGVVV